MTERTRLRLVVLQVLVLSLFVTLGGRLWYLQVVATDRYEQAASENRLRDVAVPAVRGQILDDQGRPLVRNRTAMVVSVSRTELLRQPDDGTELCGDSQPSSVCPTRSCGPGQRCAPATSPSRAGTDRRTSRSRSSRPTTPRWHCVSSSGRRSSPASPRSWRRSGSSPRRWARTPLTWSATCPRSARRSSPRSVLRAAPRASGAAIW